MNSTNKKVLDLLLANAVDNSLQEDTNSNKVIFSYLNQIDWDDVFDGSAFQTIKNRFKLQDAQVYEIMRRWHEEMSMYN